MYTRERKRGGNILPFSKSKKSKKKEDEYSIQEFVKRRDFSGGAALMEILIQDDTRPENIDVEAWLGYCYFHLGEYSKALEVYKGILKSRQDEMYHLNISCCYMSLKNFELARRHAEKAGDCPLRNRLLLQSNDQLNSEENVMVYNDKVGEGKFDQLSLASVHFRRGNYDDAIDIHKSIYDQDPKYKALAFYLALDYFYKIGTESDEEESRGISFLHKNQHFLKAYLESYPQSLTALNLLACTTHKIETAEAAEEVLQKVVASQESSYSVENLLVKHNLVVFSSGDGALKTLSGVLDIIPEARNNFITYYLRNNQLQEAYDLVSDKEFEGNRPEDFITKASVLLSIGLKNKNDTLLNEAKSILRAIGASETERNTLHGRLSWTQYLFLNKDFKEVCRYLSSISDFMEKNIEFHWNYAVSLMKRNSFKKAEKFLKGYYSLLLSSTSNQPIVSSNLLLFFCYFSRCLIMNGKPEECWDNLLKIEKSQQLKPNELITLLSIIGNDCYRMGFFWYSLKAFHMLESEHENMTVEMILIYWKAKRGSVCGVFQQIVCGKMKMDILTDLILFLSSSRIEESEHGVEVTKQKGIAKMNQEIDHISEIIKNWAQANGFSLI